MYKETYYRQARPGDLIFYRPYRGLLGWFIAWAQNVIGKSPIKKISYCHVVIVDKDLDYVLESIWPKSRRWKIDWDRLNKKYYLELWRVKETSLEKIDTVLDWAYAHLDQKYDIGLFIWGLFDLKNKEVCSTYVAKAWRTSGVHFKPSKVINGNESFLTPDELAYQTDIIKRIA